MTEIPQYIKNQMQKVIYTDNEMKPLQENFVSAIGQCVNAVVEFSTSLYNATMAFTKFAVEIIYKYVNTVYPKTMLAFPSKRVVHLAAHAKKKRVRKKNYSRMVKNYYKNIGKKCYEKKGGDSDE